uniref:NDRG family member 2 n=1 Tax=Oncorhynchus tshawytscha TaxID=74940 RepID=A0AAZ3QNJ0_ONCTS
MPRVPAHMRERTLGMLQGGMRTADVARAINCTVRTVRCLRQHYRETGQTADHPRSGRPRVTTPALDWYIRTSHMQDRYMMATTTARVTPGTHNPSISAQTVHNRLREAGLRACRPVVRQVLTRHHLQQRRLWAQTHHRWTRQDWQKVLFTDESRFCLNRYDGWIRIYRQRTEFVVISGNLNAVRYREDILLPHVVLFLQAHPDMTLQHDNATSHTAHSVCDFLQDRNVSVLPWPAKSPDLNPMEHVWDLLDRREEMSANADLVRSHRDRISKAPNLINIELFWRSYNSRRDLIIDRNSNFKCPVMLVVGDQAPHEEAAVECNSKLDPTTTSFLKMADAGGLPQLTQPSKLTEAFKYFIQGMGYMASSIMTRLSRSRTASLSSSYSMDGERQRSRTLSQSSQGGQMPPSPSHTMEVSC